MLNRYEFNIYKKEPFYIDYITALFKTLKSELTIFYLPLSSNGKKEQVFRFELTKTSTDAATLDLIHFLFNCNIYEENDRYVFTIEEKRLAEEVVFSEIKEALQVVGFTKAIYCERHISEVQYCTFKEVLDEDKAFESKFERIGIKRKDEKDGGEIVELCLKHPDQFVAVTLPLQFARLQKFALPKQDLDIGDSKLSARPIQSYVKPLNEGKYKKFFDKMEERIGLIIKEIEENEKRVRTVQGRQRMLDAEKKIEQKDIAKNKKNIDAELVKYDLEINKLKQEKEYLKLILIIKRFLQPNLTLTRCIAVAKEKMPDIYYMRGETIVDPEISILIQKEIPDFDNREHADACFSEAFKMIKDVEVKGEGKARFQSAIEQLQKHVSQKATSDYLQVATAIKDYVNNIVSHCDGVNRDKKFKKFNQEFIGRVRVIEVKSDAITKALAGAVIMAAAAFLLMFIPAATFLAAYHPYATVGVGALFGLGVGLFAANKEVVRKLVSDETNASVIMAGRRLVMGS